MNNVSLIGRLTKNPELRFLPGSGNAVCNFTMAIDKGLSKQKKQEFESQGKPTADFIRIVVWGKTAENCSQYLAKGRLAAVNGAIQSGSYKTDTGETRYTTEVLANRVEFLEWGDSKKSGKFDDDDLSFHNEDYQQIDDDEPLF